MSNDKESNETALIKTATERYHEMIVLRAAVQAIPYVGGPLDILLSGGAARIQQERVLRFLGALDQRLREIENFAAEIPEDKFLDLMLTTFERAMRANSDQKLRRFALIVARQVLERNDWNQAETAVRLMGDLDDLHVEILKVALDAPVCGPPFDRLKVITLTTPFKQGEGAPLKLTDLFPRINSAALRLACSELIARGLLHDEGVGRLETGAMEYFIATDLAEWLFNWIRER